MVVPDQSGQRPPIAFAGLGNLGFAMATGLLRAGWPVTAYDPRTEPVRAAVELGAASVGSVPELAATVADCRLLALAVPDDTAVTSLTIDSGLLDRLPPDAAVVVHSTVLPTTAQRLGELCAERGLAYVDAPVSGGAERAAEGTLTVMAGADANALERADAYLQSVASDIVHVGPPGAGSAAKLANQLMMFAALAGTHEALDLAHAYGVATDDVLTVARTSTGDSWVARTWGFFDEVAAAYDAAGTPVSYRPWSKDLWDVVAAARAGDVRMPLAGLLAQTMAEVVEAHAKNTGPDVEGTPRANG